MGALLTAAPKLSPDMLVLDRHMPLRNGLCAGQRLKQLLPREKLIYLTMSVDPDLAAEGFSHERLRSCAEKFCNIRTH